MARNWQYARWRKTARQAVLCAALGLTIALAWWVGHVRAAGLQVALGQPQTFENAVMPLTVSLPPMSDWVLKESTGGGFAMLDISEETSRYGTHRNVRLLLVRADSTGGEPLTPKQFADQQASDRRGQVSKFDFLGTSGILVEYPLEFTGKPRSRTQRFPDMLVACTSIATPKPVLVCLEMVSPIEFTPSDYELLKRLATSLSISNPAHPAPPIPKADIKQTRPETSVPEVNGGPDNDEPN